MENIENYVQVLLRNGLNINKKDVLYVGMPSLNSLLADEIRKQASNIGVQDIGIYDIDKQEDNNLSEYINKQAKFIFFVSDKADSKTMKMIYDLVNNDVPLLYIVATMPSDKLSMEEINAFSLTNMPNGSRVWKDVISDNEKGIAQLKNLKLLSLKISDLNTTDINMQLNGSFRGISQSGRISMFPCYKTEIIPVSDSATGFVEATSYALIDDTKIEDLRLYFRDGKVIDYDCASNYKKAEDFFKSSNNPTLVSVGLIDKDAPTYKKNALHGNYILDRTSNPYILISSYDSINEENKYMYVPLGSGNLKLTASNMQGKKLVIYENESFTKKVLPNKK